MLKTNQSNQSNQNIILKEENDMKKNEEFIKEYVNSKSIYYFYTTLLKEIKKRQRIIKTLKWCGDDANISEKDYDKYAFGITNLENIKKEFYKMYQSHLKNNGANDCLLKRNIEYMFLNHHYGSDYLRHIFLKVN